MPGVRPAIRVCTAAESAALDRAAIAAGIPGRALMQRAGAAAAGEIARRHPAELQRGALVLAGPGNNGGDGWVIARALGASGVPVRVWESAPASGSDAGAERALAMEQGIRRADTPRWEGEGVVIDALLGTGATGALRETVAEGVRAVADARARGAVIVAVDVPTGVDATTGEVSQAPPAVCPQLTLTFATLKRGHLVAREQCGTIVVLDIGLPVPRAGAFAAGEAGAGADTPSQPEAPPLLLLDAAGARALLPAVRGDAHKGTKGHVAIVGGAEGMAGAVILAAQGALRAGAGLVRIVAHAASLDAVRCAVPQALTAAWGDDDAALALEIAGWADSVAIGPGLGTTPAARKLVEMLLDAGDAPAVLDADALNVFAGDAPALRKAIGSRRVLLTPHPAEMMRLAGAAGVDEVLAGRFELGARFAADVGATVLLKGVPTVISSPDGRRLVTASGTSALATGGSGDVLTGMAATLLAHMPDALEAGAVAAWAHGRAAEIASADAGTTRGVPLDAVLAHLAHEAWRGERQSHPYPVLCELA